MKNLHKIKNTWYNRLWLMLLLLIAIPVYMVLFTANVILYPLDYIIFGHDQPYMMDLTERFLDYMGRMERAEEYEKYLEEHPEEIKIHEYDNEGIY